MSNTGFRFKQFQVNHDRCAMKVGTDGILLGAWADVAQAKQILDLGSEFVPWKLITWRHNKPVKMY